MGHLRKEKTRRKASGSKSDSGDSKSPLSHYWLGGEGVDGSEMESGVIGPTEEVVKVRRFSTEPGKSNNNPDRGDDLFIWGSVCDGGNGWVDDCDDGIRCEGCSCHHRPVPNSDHYCYHHHQNHNKVPGGLGHGNWSRSGSSENKTIHETKMFRCNKEQERLLSPNENRISSSPSDNNSEWRSDTRKIIKRSSSLNDLEKMGRKRKKNSLTPCSQLTTTTTVPLQPFSPIRDSGWREKKKKKSIKRDTDEVDMSSVDESVPTLAPSPPNTALLPQLNSATSPCSPLNNLVSCITSSWPFILGKDIRLGHLFMTPEAKTVPFRESSKSLDDKCGSRRRDVDGGDQLDMGKEQQQAEGDNHHHHLYVPSSPIVKKGQRQSGGLLVKEKEFVQVDDDVDLLGKSCTYRATPNNKSNKGSFSPYGGEKEGYPSSSNHHQHQEERFQRSPLSKKSRKNSFPRVFWIIALVTGSWINPCFAQGPVIEVQAVAHKKAILPCDMNAPIRSDDAILVLWYKDLGDMPIYSYDGRNRPGTHAKNELLLGQRAYFRTVTEPAALQIDNVSENDAGLYRCRVDFLKSPTRNSKVNLTVIECSIQRVASIIVEDENLIESWTSLARALDISNACIKKLQQDLLLNKISYSDLFHDVLEKWIGIKGSNAKLVMLLLVIEEECTAVSAGVPPQKPTIFDGQARELGGTAGPYNEEASMTLTCIASGGRPSPKVTWWRGGSLVDESYQIISSDGATQNTMTVGKLTRSDLHAVYTCQASNNNLSEPISSSVQVEMYFRPLEVTLLGSNQPMSALQEIEIVCQSVGSRPPAEISWYKDGQHLKSSREEVSPTGNISTSVLKLTPRVGDHGKSLTCRAENTRLEGSALEDSWKLVVFFVPILTLKLGPSLDPENIREGGDVYLECNIKANPWVYKVVWEHNGQVVQHNASAGIIMSNQSLVLQKVRRASGGTYVCIATNIEGEGRSNPVELSVMYKPICRMEQKRVFGVAKGEQVEIECKVDANPTADTFRWAFNNSADSIDVPQTRVTTPKLGSSSVLRYTPHTELDYGSVVCLATNIIGQQMEPCVFHIIAAGFKMRASVGHGIYRHQYLGKPDPPFNCTTQNITSESLEVECLEGFDGGLPQVFHADIVDAGTSRLLWNLTSQIPFFVINGLKPGQALRVFVRASNRKGYSENFILEAQTIQEAEKRTASPVDFELTPMLGVCVGVVCGLLVVALGIVLALKFRTDTRHPPPLKATKTEYRVEVNDSEEKNPDIIPSSKDSDYFYNDGLYNGPKRNGSITDNFRNCTYYSDKSNSEITYAELCLDAPGPNGNPGMIGPGGGGVVGGGGGGGGSIGVGNVGGGWSTVDRKRRRNPTDEPPSNAVIYATIDHSRMRTNGEPPAHLQPHQREIVSVRTPLLVSSQQESCV